MDKRQQEKWVKNLKELNDFSHYEFIIACATCNKVFLSQDYEPKKWWYFTAVEHWLQNPTHEVIFYQVLPHGEADITCFSVLWRRAGVRNVLREIQHLKRIRTTEGGV